MNKSALLTIPLVVFVLTGCSEEDAEDSNTSPELRGGIWLQSSDIETVKNGITSQSYLESPVILKLNSEYSGDEESGEEALTITYCGESPSGFTYSSFYNTIYFSKSMEENGEQWSIEVDGYESLTGEGSSYYTEEDDSIIENTTETQLFWHSDETSFDDGQFNFEGGALGSIDDPSSLCVNKSIGYFPEYSASVSFHATYINEEITITLTFPTEGNTSLTNQSFEVGDDVSMTISSPSLSGGSVIEALTAVSGTIDIESFTGVQMQSYSGVAIGSYAITLPDGNSVTGSFDVEHHTYY